MNLIILYVVKEIVPLVEELGLKVICNRNSNLGMISLSRITHTSEMKYKLYQLLFELRTPFFFNIMVAQMTKDTFKYVVDQTLMYRFGRESYVCKLETCKIHIGGYANEIENNPFTEEELENINYHRLMSTI